MFQKLKNRKPKKVTLGEGAILAREASITNESEDSENLKIGKGCLIMGQLLSGRKGRLAMGDHGYVGPGARIWALHEIRIGDRVFISHGVNLHDSDSHSLSARERHERFLEKMKYGAHQKEEPAKAAPLIVEDDVWIGFNAIVLKGVRIGRGAVVGAGSVVTKEIPPFTVVVGNPARVVGKSLP